MDTADTIEVLSPPPGEPVTAPSSPTQEHGGAGGLPNIQGVPPHWPNWSREQDRTPLPHKHGKSKRRRRHPTLHTPNLPIPDLRYEQSFLSSIRSCVQILPESKSEKQQDEKDSDDDKAAAVPYTPAAGSEWWLAKNVKIAWYVHSSCVFSLRNRAPCMWAGRG